LHGGQELPLLSRVIDQNTLRKLDLAGHDIESALNNSLPPCLVIQGMYRHLGDAGTFTERLTKQRWPVAQEGNSAALERAYLNMRREPGEELIVSVEGYVKMLPPMEGSHRQPSMVVDRFIGMRHASFLHP